MLSYLKSQHYDFSTIIIPILHVRKLCSSKIKYLAQGRIKKKKSSNFDPKALALT